MWWKMLLCLPLGAGAFRYPLLYAVYGGHFFRPDCPMWVELLCSWLFISLIMLLGLLVVLELLLLPLRLLQRRWAFFRKLRHTLLALCAPVALLTAAYLLEHALTTSAILLLLTAAAASAGLCLGGFSPAVTVLVWQITAGPLCYFTAAALVLQLWPEQLYRWQLCTIFSLAGIGWATINVNSFPMVVEMCSGADVGKYTGYYYTASMAAQTLTPMVSGFLMDKLGMGVLFPYAALFVAGSFVTMLFVKHGDSKVEAKRGLTAFDVED